MRRFSREHTKMKRGDIVTLLSSPDVPMTVADILPDDIIVCVWLDAQHCKQQAAFYAHTLSVKP